MSGAGVGETPNAAFAALSARGSSLGIAGLSSGITDARRIAFVGTTTQEKHGTAKKHNNAGVRALRAVQLN